MFQILVWIFKLVEYISDIYVDCQSQSPRQNWQLSKLFNFYFMFFCTCFAHYLTIFFVNLRPKYLFLLELTPPSPKKRKQHNPPPPKKKPPHFSEKGTDNFIMSHILFVCSSVCPSVLMSSHFSTLFPFISNSQVSVFFRFRTFSM